MLSAYAQNIAEGAGIKATKQPHIKTIQGYIRAAAGPAVAGGRDDPRYLPRCTTFSGARKYVPLLETVFETARKWTPPKHDEKQPISVAILTTIVRAVPSRDGAELTLPAAVRDACILGSFTGSRVSEYAQTQLRKGTRFNTVPLNTASGREGGKPIAFVIGDFTFFSADKLEVLNTQAHQAAYIRIRFRFTKAGRAFTFRMFAAIPKSPFCPVLAGARAVKRWLIVAPGTNTPLFCFWHTFLSKRPSFLLDRHMTAALRAAAKKTHPDASHLVHQHMASITAHSLRVFACLCLKLAGWDEEAIAHQLRWESSAIKTYIRQAMFQADTIGASLFKSALAI